MSISSRILVAPRTWLVLAAALALAGLTACVEQNTSGTENPWKVIWTSSTSGGAGLPMPGAVLQAGVQISTGETERVVLSNGHDTIQIGAKTTVVLSADDPRAATFDIQDGGLSAETADKTITFRT